MRAYGVHSFGEAPGMFDLPIPEAAGAVIIRVTYAGINPVDYKLVEQLNSTSTYPFIMGVDFAGVVESVPSVRHDLQVGNRVFGLARRYGSYAEYTAIVPGAKGEALARIPDTVTDEQAAALPVAAIAALGSIGLLGIGTGHSLVIMGATGGVGGYAVQMASERGAHVIATVRGDEDEVRRLGASEVYNTKSADAIDTIRAAHPDGVDAVLDLVNGKGTIQRDIEILKPGGSLVSAIYAADEAWFADRKITAYNVSGATNPFASTEGLTEIARMLADGIITTRIRLTVELEEASQVLEKLQTGGLRGKAVIRL